MTLPAISVFVPHYNCTDTLPRLFASLAAQTVPPHEILFVDDGSDSDPGPEIDRLRGALNLRLLRQGRNRGVRSARYRAYTEATGDAILQVDADDALTPDALATFGAAMAETGAEIVQTQLDYVAPDGTRRQPLNELRRALVTGPDVLPSFVNLTEAARGWPHGAAGGKLLRQDIARAIAKRIGDSVHQVYAEDTFANCIAMDLADKMLLLPEAPYLYFAREDSSNGLRIGAWRDKFFRDTQQYREDMWAFIDDLETRRPALAEMFRTRQSNMLRGRIRTAFPGQRPFGRDFEACLAQTPPRARALFRQIRIETRNTAGKPAGGIGN